MHIRIYVYMYICIYVYMYIIYVYICIYVSMYMCIYVYMYLCIYVYMYTCKAQQQGAPLAGFGVLGLLPWQLTSPRAQTRCLRVLPKAMHCLDRPCSVCSVSWLFWAGYGPKHMPAAYCQGDLHPCLTPVPAMQVRLWLYLVRSTTQVQPGWIMLTLDWLLGLITLQVCRRCRCHKTSHAGCQALMDFLPLCGCNRYASVWQAQVAGHCGYHVPPTAALEHPVSSGSA